jgi:F-type H+-transporting ATPase subunit alpha
VVIIYAGTKGLLDEVPVAKLKDFEAGLLEFIADSKPEIYEQLTTERKMTDALVAMLDGAVAEFKKRFAV